MVPARFSKAEGEQEDGAHKLPSPESIAAGPCSSDQHIKISK